MEKYIAELETSGYISFQDDTYSDTLILVVNIPEEASPYFGKEWDVNFRFVKKFPDFPPVINFKDDILHPNVIDKHFTTVWIKEDKWDPKMSITGVVNKFIETIKTPVFEGCSHPLLKLAEDNPEKFANLAKARTEYIIKRDLEFDL